MLRVYECNWCGTRQTKDDGCVHLVPDGDKMAYKLVGTCCMDCRKTVENFKPIMHPLRKDRNGDWKFMLYSERLNTIPILDEVIPTVRPTY